MRVEVTKAVPARTATVWEILVDVERWPQWTASMHRVALERPLAVGTTVLIDQPRLPRVRWTVTEVDPGRSFTWRSTLPGSHTDATHRVTDAGDGTSVVTLTVEQGGPVGAVVGRLYRRLTRRYVQMEADGLAAEAARRAT